MIYYLLSGMHQIPGSVHAGMFIKCIDILGTDQQREHFLQKCKNY